MAKDRERALARRMYVEQGKEQKEIAHLLGITEKTVGNWVGKYRWKSQREAHLNSSVQRLENIRKVVSDITEERLRLRREATEAKNRGDDELVREINKQVVGLDDAIAKWNKALAGFEKDNRVTLSLYLEVMDSIFDALARTDRELYLKTLDFQQEHVEAVSIRLG
jgi:predicted transcriptional regulator